MGATQIDEGSALGKGGLIAVSILGAVLVIASIWSLSRALGNSSPHGSAVPTNAATTMDTVLSQEEIERRQYEMAEQRTAPVIQTPVALPLTVIPTKQQNDEVVLQKAKAKVNQRIVERMKQYIRDNPNLDTREIEKQIKKRENQGVPIQ